MTPAQLKALLAEGIKDFAGYRISIEYELPYGLKSSYANVSSCPTGLKKITVIEDGVKWDEIYTFGCGCSGDKEHKTPRRNGVLIEFELELLKEYETLEATEKAWKGVRLAEVVERGKKKFVRLIVSRKAIIVPWGEYSMVDAEREKLEKALDERRAEMRALVDALKIPDSKDSTWWWDRGSFRSEQSVGGEDDWNRKRRESAHFVMPKISYDGRKEIVAYFGLVTMPMDHAQKLANALDTLRQIADPKERHSQRARDMAARALVEIEAANKPPRKLAKKKRQAK